MRRVELHLEYSSWRRTQAIDTERECDNRTHSEAAVCKAFVVLHLLSGSKAEAEASLLGSIQQVESDLLQSQAFLQTAIQRFFRGRDTSDLQDEDLPASSSLPPEMNQVLALSAQLRHSYVLRVLCGFSTVTCCEWLQVGEEEFNECVCRALLALPLRLM
jgi:hypothetical protein